MALTCQIVLIWGFATVSLRNRTNDALVNSSELQLLDCIILFEIFAFEFLT